MPYLLYHCSNPFILPHLKHVLYPLICFLNTRWDFYSVLIGVWCQYILDLHDAVKQKLLHYALLLRKECSLTTPGMVQKPRGKNWFRGEGDSSSNSAPLTWVRPWVWFRASHAIQPLDLSQRLHQIVFFSTEKASHNIFEKKNKIFDYNT